MSKYYKLIWSGNIIRNILEDFQADVIDETHHKYCDIGQWQSRYGDFNGDGKQDILISYFNSLWGNYGYHATHPANGQLVLLLGDGTNGFKDGSSLLPHHGRLDSSMSIQPTVADFNGDGVDDIVLNNHSEDGRFNAGAWPCEQYAYISKPGGFKQVDLDFKTEGRSSVSGDFNNDGRLDFSVFGWTPGADGDNSEIYLQNADGSFTRHGSGWVGGNLFVSGDFDGDGEIEFAAFNGYDTIRHGFVNRLYELNDDGTVGPSIFTWEIPYKLTDDDWALNKTKSGILYNDDGLHFADTGDVDGDGSTDVVACHYAQQVEKKNGEYIKTNDMDFLSIYSGAGGQGMHDLHATFRGYTYPKGLLDDVKLVDWNGDGHLDVFVSWEDQTKKGPTEAERVFLNDGTGTNYTRLAQKYLPGGDNPHMTEFGDYTDANNDGIMDVLVRPSGTYHHEQWDAFSESLYLGTKQIYDGTDHNPATDGAPGFNEAYYRHELKDHHLTIKGHMTALEHYLSVGKDKGLWGFAPGTHVFGYSGNDTITLREGNESAQGLGGNDKLTGGAGADTLSGGTGDDRFIYLAATDSGTTDESRDVITDFKHGSDLIDLATIDAKLSTDTDDKFDFIGQDAFTSQEGQLRWSSVSTANFKGIIVEGDINGDGIADFQIALQGSKTIDEHDITL
jgi:hypothetical protein